MRKEVKIVIVLIISLLIMNIKVEAATGVGICYNKTVLDSSGYCKLDSPINIYGKAFGYAPLDLTNGKSASKYSYYGTIENKNHELFCIDPNLPAPGSTPYQYARPFNMNSDYDRAIAKVYLMHVNDTAWIMNSSNISFEAASANYEQIANVAMRALTKKYKYDIDGSGQIYENHYDKIFAQFEGKKSADPKLVEGTEAFKLAQKYYCSAILACKNCNGEGIPEAKNFCSKLEGVSTSPIPEFKVTVKSTDNIEIINTDNSDEFSRVIEMKITGLSSFIKDYETFAKTEPYFKITNVSCENSKLTCGVESGVTLNQDILNGLSGDEYTFKVKVSGNKKDFLTETSGKIKIDYESHHILNINNLAVLRYTLSPQTKQRMIALMPKRVETQYVNVSFPIPAMCQTEIVGKSQIYKYGGKEVSEVEYLQSGCCNINSAYLKTKEAHNYYFEHCDVDVDIHLETNCINDGDADNMSHSFIYQKPVDKVLRNVKELRSGYSSNNYDKNSFQEELKKYNYHRDDNYLYTPSENANDAISTSNKYCQMYTSENQDIYYPGTVEATSGRFFIFNSQPYINGEINGIFYTDIEQWENDYDAAIQEEKSAYYEWQDALNDPEIEDASSYENHYNRSVKNREKLQTLKAQCEGKTDIVNKWKYSLEPDLIFNYQQDYLDPISNKKTKITEKVEMQVSTKAEKYWPNVSDKNPILITGSVEGTRSNRTKTISYGGVSERFTYDRTESYKAGFKQTLYYIPKVKYYSLIPDGKYVTSVNEYDSTNYLDVGYVFNVKITTYQGEYTTWFTVNSLGHLMQSPKIKPKSTSNIQALLDEYLDANKSILDITDTKNEIDGSKFVNKCYYKDEEILYKRECPTCEDDANFKVQYYSRTVANDNLFPNENSGNRVTGANWTSDKGQKAKALIESASNTIYGDGDGSKAYLEYSFTLTPTKMQEIKKDNKNNNLSKFDLKCKTSGKECESILLTDLAKESKESQSILQNTRAEGWKYFIDGTWVRGSISTYLKNGYPEDDAKLTNWP